MSAPTDLVVLLPGWGTPPVRLEPLSDALTRAGAVARVWSYVPRGAYPELVDQFVAAVRALRAQHGPDDRLHLVGHSLGGIVAADTALRQLDDLAASVTTINTPWRGTWVSYTGSGPLARTLRWRSPVLAGLRDALAVDLLRSGGPRWLLLSAAGDLATPASTSLAGIASCPRLTRRVVAATGHSVSLTSPRLVDVVCQHVLAADGVPAASVPEDRWRALNR